ncbi:MAG: cobyrinate a,c-diamide synthase [Synergistaceae bacterium]|nr:cobyrinate a,c-diamide synthase [Synergistaceae bacterium]
MTRRIIISGAGSHCGKTTVACGLLSAFREHGLKVCAYKTGPDYIDTQYLRNAGRCEAYNLDTWLMTPERVRELFMMTSRGKDIAVIEGAMGLYDGGMNSTAEIAKLLHAPVIAVINAKSVGETAASIALGLREYDHEINLAGVILNHADSDSHVKIISDSLERTGIKLLGAIKRNDKLIIPERHLGLLPLNENMNYDFASVRAVIESCVNIDEVIRVSESSCETHGSLSSWPCASHKAGIAIARDEAFNFYYPESIETLKHMGAEIIYFSPLHDECIPKADGYIFGGGFPEIFARELEMNTSMRESVRKAANSGACILAECGGYMYLCDSLTDRDGKKYRMAGVIHSDAFMTDKPVIGYIEAKALSDNILCSEGDIIRGHEFHYSRVNQTDTFAFNMTRRRTGESYSGGYAHGNILASYLHMNFFGNIKLAERFLSRIDINQTSR